MYYTEEPRRGFPLIGFLLKVLIVLIIVFVLMILFPLPNFNPLFDKMFGDNINSMRDAGLTYYTNERLPQNDGDSTRISLQQMIDKKLLLEFTDKNGKSCDKENSYIEVTKTGIEYEMKVYLSCKNQKDYIVVPMGCYDKCDSCLGKTQLQYQFKKAITLNKIDYSCPSGYKRSGTNCIGNVNEIEKIDATVKTTCPTGYGLSNNKCVKAKTSEETIDAKANTKYTCPTGYTKNGQSCETDVLSTKEATVSYSCPTGYTRNGTICSGSKHTKKVATVSYSCPTGYTMTLEGTTCSKSIVSNINATVSYSCPTGYALNGTTCNKTINSSTNATVSYSCPSGYTRSGTTCSKTTSYQEANGYTSWVYSYSQKSKTALSTYTDTLSKRTYWKTEFEYDCSSCFSGTTYYYYKVWTRNINYVTKYTTDTKTASTNYNCPTGYTRSGTTCYASSISSIGSTANYSCPSGYTKNGTTCSKNSTSTINGTKMLSCSSGYVINGEACYKTTATTREATTNYSCPSGYTRSGSICEITTKISIDANRQVTYTCPNNYVLSGKTCKKIISITEEEDAIKTYSCPSGYTLNEKICSKNVKSTKKVKATIKSTKKKTFKYTWSSSKTLSGWQATGKTRTIK